MASKRPAFPISPFLSIAITVIISLSTLGLASAAHQPRTIQSFGVQLKQGQPVYPLPANVALGLCNPDPLFDVAYCFNGKVQVYQNMGNGLFDFVGERGVAGEIRVMEWRKERMFAANISNLFSWGELHVVFKDGRSEVISHEQLLPAQIDLRFSSRNTIDPSLDFREVWHSSSQTQPNTYMALADIDNDGRIEVAYCFFPQFGDSNRFVVYECVGNDSFVVEWDTILVGGFGPLAATDLDRNGYGEWVIVSNGPKFLESAGNGHYRCYDSNISWSSVGYITKGIQTDIDHDGIPEVCIQQANPSPPPGGDATFIYVSEFAFKSGSTMAFSIQLARYAPYTFDMAVGQLDGTGRDEIIPSGGSFGFHEPVPLEYLWYNGTTWVARQIYTGLESGTTAEMFVNLDSDSTRELFVGGVGPVGHGSCYTLDYVSDTTWRVMWADSTLRTSPLSIDAGSLDGQFIVAGANTLERIDTFYTQLHVYHPMGLKLGIWQKDSASMQNFHILDIDNDGRANLVTPFISALILDHLGVYEYFGSTAIGEISTKLDGVQLFQNYPNPFNPTTTIAFDLPTKSKVSVSVYDILGREAVRLLEAELQAGNHRVQWDGICAGGNRSSSGVYFLRLTASSGSGWSAVTTRKMLLIR